MSRHFVLALHSHLPWVLHHGRWPHGSDWLCEAAIDTYLPLLAALKRLQSDGIPAPITLGITPVLAAQLAHRSFRDELDLYFEQRLLAVHDTASSIRGGDEEHLGSLIPFWRDRLTFLRRLWYELGGDLLAGFRSHAEAGRIELITSAATHGFLPLLGRDESIRLQLLVGRAEHIRHFGMAPEGIWVPECAYRPRDFWAPTPDAPQAGKLRRGIEEHLAAAGFHWFFIDAHLAGAGALSDPYTDQPELPTRTGEHSPYRIYHVGAVSRGKPVRILVRDPVTTAQIWNRHGGYPGDGRYLEFHKLRQGGLRFWSVTDPKADLGDKLPYDPEAAQRAIREHVRHFTGTLSQFSSAAEAADRVITAPFDTELFGHWWFEGIDFLEATFRSLAATPLVTPSEAGPLVHHSPSGGRLTLQEGSWGANGDFSMWLNSETEWTWQRIWALEDRFWDVVPHAMRSAEALPVLAQAGRELLLMQSSDWQFIISTGLAGDYATQRFLEHAQALEELLLALEPGGNPADARTRTAMLERIDGPFPDIIGAIGAAADVAPEL